MRLPTAFRGLYCLVLLGTAATTAEAKFVVQRDVSRSIRRDQVTLQDSHLNPAGSTIDAAKSYMQEDPAATNADDSHIYYLDQGFVPPLEWIRGEHEGANETCSKVGREGYRRFRQQVSSAVKAEAWTTEDVEVAGSAKVKGQEKGEMAHTTSPGIYQHSSLNQSVYYSPPFYPTPQTTGAGTGLNKRWKSAVKKAKSLLKEFTLEEKVALVTGAGWEGGNQPRCVGNIVPNERVGFPGLCLEDSPAGVRFADGITVWPAGVTTAATFSSSLSYARGRAMGEEFRAKGVNIALGPGMNMARAPAAGRNWEMASADPYLTGESAYHTTKGLQDAGVQACAKHYLGNEQEINRNTYSSNIDGRTEREIYLHPFMRSIQAGVASVMCSYNLHNNSWSCQNSEMLNNRLKTELGFNGFVMSDWGAQHSGVASANAGLDMTMPGQVECCAKNNKGSFWGQNLTMAVQNKSVETSRLDDMGTRILAAWYLLGQDSKDYPKPNFDAFDATYGEHTQVTSHKHAKIAREVAAAGTVVLKNSRNALPLQGEKLRKLAVVGSDAGPLKQGANFYADRGGPMIGTLDGTIGIGWGSGTADYSYFVSPYEALQARARKDITGFYWTFDNWNLDQAQKISASNIGVDAALVFVYSDSGENYIVVDANAGDRNNLTLWGNGVELVKSVASVQNNTVVIINAPGQVDLEDFIDHPNVTAVVHAHFPGAEAGNAITDILYGDVNPSGRLPYTIAKRRSDYSADVQYFSEPETETSQIDYIEKLNIDYRHFDSAGIEPRFAFGHGLSYTNFTYSGATGRWLDGSKGGANWNDRKWTLPLPDWLFEDVYELAFDIKNVGQKDGFEVPQVYLGFSPSSEEPPKVLRKFDRFAISADTTRTVTFRLNRYDLSVWNSEQQRWWRPDGDVKVFIGASSRDIRLTLDKM